MIATIASVAIDLPAVTSVGPCSPVSLRSGQTGSPSWQGGAQVPRWIGTSPTVMGRCWSSVSGVPSSYLQHSRCEWSAEDGARRRDAVIELLDDPKFRGAAYEFGATLPVPDSTRPVSCLAGEHLSAARSSTRPSRDLRAHAPQRAAQRREQSAIRQATAAVASAY